MENGIVHNNDSKSIEWELVYKFNPNEIITMVYQSKEIIIPSFPKFSWKINEAVDCHINKEKITAEKSFVTSIIGRL